MLPRTPIKVPGFLRRLPTVIERFLGDLVSIGCSSS